MPTANETLPRFDVAVATLSFAPNGDGSYAAIPTDKDNRPIGGVSAIQYYDALADVLEAIAIHAGAVDMPEDMLDRLNDIDALGSLSGKLWATCQVDELAFYGDERSN